ncbi:hypothetical protein E4U55_000759 [Claviceps digitariae]|nr:hypothetical protein E4U55_000759 [Claviceps digitariae]
MRPRVIRPSTLRVQLRNRSRYSPRKRVSTSAEVRAAASNAFKAVQGALKSIYESDAFFALVDAVVKKQGPQGLDEESEQLFSDTHVACINMGLKLSAEERHRFEQMMERRTDLRTAFSEEPWCRSRESLVSRA